MHPRFGALKDRLGAIAVNNNPNQTVSAHCAKRAHRLCRFAHDDGYDARVRGAGVVVTGAGGVVTTGAVVAGVGGGEVVTGAAGTAATGAVGVAATGALDRDDPVGAAEDCLGVLGDGDTGGAPAAGVAAGSTAEPAIADSDPPGDADAPVTVSSIVSGVLAVAWGALSASAATIAVVAARLMPAVKARVAGAVVRLVFDFEFRDGRAEPPSTAADRAVGLRSVIVVVFFVIFVFVIFVIIVFVVIIVI